MNIVDRYANADEYSHSKFDKRRTQKDMCLEYLETYGSITPLEALSAFNCFRLSAIIFELRESGYAIKTNLNDGEKKFAIYSLMKEEAENNG